MWALYQPGGWITPTRVTPAEQRRLWADDGDTQEDRSVARVDVVPLILGAPTRLLPTACPATDGLAAVMQGPSLTQTALAPARLLRGRRRSPQTAGKGQQTHRDE